MKGDLVVMAVCFFNEDYDYKHRYRCEYEVLDDCISVTVDYDISEEIEVINGCRSFGPKTEFSNRDILIVDHYKKTNYLLKDAYYDGSSSVFSNPDGGSKTRFTADICFRSNSYNSLADLKATPKVSSITIVSDDLKRYIIDSSVEKTVYEDRLEIILKKYPNGETRQIGANNINELYLHDSWSGGFNKDHDISFDITGCLEIKLRRKVNYKEIPRYVFEEFVYLQLFTNKHFNIDAVKVSIDGVNFQLFFRNRFITRRTEKHKYYDNSVRCNLMDFLVNCYSCIPYRKSKSDIRNISYILMNRDRSIEDNFLMYYRFVECYYKKQTIPNIRKQFISYSLKNNYMDKGRTLPIEIEKLASEIISLRNHYVHSGYYIRNESLRIKCDEKEKNYTVKADINWIYERTKVLYDCSVDIIFRNMLGYDTYTFS